LDNNTVIRHFKLCPAVDIDIANPKRIQELRSKVFPEYYT